MTTVENTSAARKAHRFLRPRVVWGIVALCLLLWGSKAIHRAMQPQYQGKTVEEWFEIEKYPSSPYDAESNDTKAERFKNLGTNAVWFLWQEYKRDDSKFTAWMMAQKQRVFQTRYYGGDHQTHRQSHAFNLLCLLRANAEPLIPVLISELKTGDPAFSDSTALLLGFIHRQPEVTVPALIESLSMTNRPPFPEHGHFHALGEFGAASVTALPVLRSRLAETNRPTYARAKIASSILKITGPGPELAYFTNHIVAGDTSFSLTLTLDLGDIGTNARPAAPLLRQFAGTLGDKNLSNYVMEVVRKIDPEGPHQKP